MNSEQLSKLKQISEESKAPIVIHDLQDICKQKIFVNKLTKEFLKIQIQMSEESKKLQDYSIQNAIDKMDIVDTLIELYEKQLVTYDKLRQNESIILYNNLNDMNSLPDKIIKLLSNLEVLDDKLKDLSVKIDQYSSCITNEKLGNQYIIKQKQPDNLLNSCAVEYSNERQLDTD